MLILPQGGGGSDEDSVSPVMTIDVILGSILNGASAMVQWHFVYLLAAPLAAGLSSSQPGGLRFESHAFMRNGAILGSHLLRRSTAP